VAQFISILFGRFIDENIVYNALNSNFKEKSRLCEISCRI